jgi:hypothetical protein
MWPMLPSCKDENYIDSPNKDSVGKDDNKNSSNETKL